MIPAQVMLCGFPVTVRLVQDLPGSFSECHFNEDLIEIVEGQSELRTMACLLHECLHYIHWRIGKTEDDEEQCLIVELLAPAACACIPEPNGTSRNQSE